jgi:hypothetical protein
MRERCPFAWQVGATSTVQSPKEWGQAVVVGSVIVGSVVVGSVVTGGVSVVTEVAPSVDVGGSLVTREVSLREGREGVPVVLAASFPSHAESVAHSRTMLNSHASILLGFIEDLLWECT